MQFHATDMPQVHELEQTLRIEGFDPEATRCGGYAQFNIGRLCKVKLRDLKTKAQASNNACLKQQGNFR
jgi:hypothetical protein